MLLPPAAPVLTRPALRREVAAPDQIYVCPLTSVHDLLMETRASHLVSVINARMMLATPGLIDNDCHLRLAMNDIAEPQTGLTMPAEEHVDRLLDFVSAWDRRAPMVVHCWAGISRSTAAALITLCALNPRTPESRIGQRLRAASSTASPNRRLIDIADRRLGRAGRLLAALDAMGTAEPAAAGVPFSLPARIA